jgi:hypothetical protein
MKFSDTCIFFFFNIIVIMPKYIEIFQANGRIKIMCFFACIGLHRTTPCNIIENKNKIKLSFTRPETHNKLDQLENKA